MHSKTARRTGIFLLLAFAASVLAYCWTQGREPQYQGRNATSWLTNSDAQLAEAAFRAMGPPGVVFLGRTLEKRPSELTQKIDSGLESFNMPAALRLGLHDDQLFQRSAAAALILRRLGTSGQAALPSLMRIYRESDPQDHSVVSPLMQPLLRDHGELAAQFLEDMRRLPANAAPVPDKSRQIEDIDLLGAIGPKAASAIPVLQPLIATNDPSLTLHAVRALWRINRQTNLLVNVFASCLQARGALAVEALELINSDASDLEPLTPVLEKALRYPDLPVRRMSGYLLWKINPRRLQEVTREVNAHAEQELRANLQLLASTNYQDKFNAASSLHVFSHQAAQAAPILADAIMNPPVTARTRLTAAETLAPSTDDAVSTAIGLIAQIGPKASCAVPALIRALQTRERFGAACGALASIGTNATAAIPPLKDFLATNSFNSIAPRRTVAHRPIERFDAARALLAIDPRDAQARRILEDALTNKLYLIETHYAAKVALWKAGLGPTPSVAELKARVATDPWAVALLGEMGPAAREALPQLEAPMAEYGRLSLAATIALRKIDPAEAKRIGLPGQRMMCSEKY